MSDGTQDPIRLSKRVMAQAQCSRAKAERLIEGGWVTLDGVVCLDPAHRTDNEALAIDPKAKPDSLVPLTVMGHVAAGEAMPDDAALAAMHGHAHPLVRAWHERHARCVTPLAAGASGLAVWVQDARLRSSLQMALPTLEQEWRVVCEAHPTLTADGLTALNASAPTWLPRLRGAVPSATYARASISSQNDERTVLRLVVKGVNTLALSEWLTQNALHTRELHRLRVGKVALKGLAVGQLQLLPETTRF